MVALFLTSLQVLVAPLPTGKADISMEYTALSNITLECTYVDTGNACAEHVLSNFEFYKRLLYPREVPYTVDEYFEAGMQEAISVVTATINSSAE